MTRDHDAWLAQVAEPALEPELPICDPHHHLWDRRDGRVQRGFRLLVFHEVWRVTGRDVVGRVEDGDVHDGKGTRAEYRARLLRVNGEPPGGVVVDASGAGGRRPRFSA